VQFSQLKNMPVPTLDGSGLACRNLIFTWQGWQLMKVRRPKPIAPVDADRR
jgi:hypothetical protein